MLVKQEQRSSFVQSLKNVADTAPEEAVLSERSDLGPSAKGASPPYGIKDNSVIIYCARRRSSKEEDPKWGYGPLQPSLERCFADRSLTPAILYNTTRGDGFAVSIIQLCPWWLNQWYHNSGFVRSYQGNMESLQPYRRLMIRAFTHTTLGGGLRYNELEGWRHSVTLKDGSNAETHAFFILATHAYIAFNMHPDIDGNMQEDPPPYGEPPSYASSRVRAIWNKVKGNIGSPGS